MVDRVHSGLTASIPGGSVVGRAPRLQKNCEACAALISVRLADQFGGWTCCVEQGRYGHYARKPTILYAVGTDLPELDWGESEPRYDPAVVERMGLKRAKRLGEVGARGGGTDSSPRIHTPEPFRDLLIGMARSVDRNELPLFRSAA